MALRRAFYALSTAASMATASLVVGYDACLETCTSRATTPCTADTLPVLIDCLRAECSKEGPSYRNTTNGSPDESTSYLYQLVSICGIEQASDPPHKVNGTLPVRPTAASVNATLLPTPPYSPATFLPNNTAAHDVGVGASGMVAMLGVAALLNVF